MADGLDVLFEMMMKQAKEAALSGSGVIGLGDLYTQLLTYPEDSVLVVELVDGFAFAGELESYRGYYEDLSFGLDAETTVGRALDDIAAYLDGKSYEGYKGGEFYADSSTLVWASEYGTYSGRGITGTMAMGDHVILTTVDTND